MKRIRVASVLLSLMLLSSTTVYTAPSGSGLGGAIGGAFKDMIEDSKDAVQGIVNNVEYDKNMDEKQKAGKETLVGHCGADYIDNARLTWEVLICEGYTKEATAGIIGNLVIECGLNPGIAKQSASHVGIVQWSAERKTKLIEYAKAENDSENDGLGKYTLQLTYMLAEMTHDNGGIANYQYEGKDDRLQELKECTDIDTATEMFDADMERSGGQAMADRKKYAHAVFDWLEKYPVDGENEDREASADEKEVVELAVSSGIWDETQFVKWKEMTGFDDETVLEKFKSLSILDMHEDDINDLENWKSDIEKARKDNFLIRGGRWLAILFGILFEIWMMLMYLAYWFDRINNFVEVSLLQIISFGKLRISADETECTFSVKSLAMSEVRTINHKKLLGVVIVGLSFGSLIISGVMFEWLHKGVNLMLSVLD